MKTGFQLFCLFINWLVQVRCLCSVISNTFILPVIKVTLHRYQFCICGLNSKGASGQYTEPVQITSPLPCSEINPVNALKH